MHAVVFSRRSVSAIVQAFALVIATTSLVSAQSSGTTVPSGSGRDFWIVFQKNFRDFITDERTRTQSPAAELSLELTLTSGVACEGYVEVDGLEFRKDFRLAPGAATTIEVPNTAQVRGSYGVDRRAVHVVADQPVTVYGLNHRYQTSETFAAIPTSALGNEYRVVGYRWLQNDLVSQMAVVATDDSTVVTVTPTAAVIMVLPTPAPARTSAIGKPITVMLARGDVFPLIASYDPKLTSDLTGTLVRSSKPVAVFSGHNCAYVPNMSVKACNVLVEQMPPTSSWGHMFGIGALKGRTRSVVRVIANQDSTVVSINDREVATLKAGEFHEDANVLADALILTSRPALVAQFSQGFEYDNVGDPMMLIVPPIEQFDNVYTIATPVRGSWHHYINVIAKNDAIDGLRIDGHPFDQTLFRELGKSGYSVGRIPISFGSHMVTGNSAFGLYQYGLGFDEAAYDAYGNNGGQLYIDLANPEETGKPNAEKPDIGILLDDRHPR